MPLNLERGETLQWSAAAGRTYQLEAQAEAGGPWVSVGDEVVGDGEEQRYFSPAEEGSLLNRVREEMPSQEVEQTLPGNGDFEVGSGATATFWTTGGSQPPQRYSGDARRGGFSMRSLLNNAVGGANEGLLLTNVVASGGSIVTGQSYRFSFWARQISSGPSYVQQYEVRWLGAGGAVFEWAHHFYALGK